MHTHIFIYYEKNEYSIFYVVIPEECVAMRKLLLTAQIHSAMVVTEVIQFDYVNYNILQYKVTRNMSLFYVFVVHHLQFIS